MVRSLTFLGALSTALAAPTYDYIVVGGGTSGLVIANRLSENPDVSVLIIEAGGSVLNNYNVTDVDGYGLAFGTDIDWQYETVNQPYAGDLTQTLRAGKALSGTSAINGMAYTRAEDVQIDAWQTIGNEGWTWDSLLPYYLKSENLTAPTASQRAEGATYDADVNGEDGPLSVGWPDIPVNNLTTLLNETFEGLGVPWTEDVNGGKMRGLNVFPSTINYTAYVREDAARAYYWPIESRPNLHLLLDTFVNRLVWSDETSEGDITAAGVEITSANGTVSVIDVSQEVIVSAGALKSPAILELSGIGNPAILDKYNITVKVDLPTVGENLQDQTNAGMYASTPSGLTGGKVVIYPNVTDVYGNETSTVAASVRSQLQQWANETAKVSSGTMSAEVLEAMFKVQYDLIFNSQIPIAEILYYPGGTDSLSAQYWALLPFARGNVHIGSADPTVYPTINPNYYKFDWDLDSQIEVSKYIRKTFESAPLSDIVVEETTPGFSDVAADASEEVWTEWLFTQYRSNFHPVGTAIMLPKEKGGVVDTKNVVYGTSNVRVVDASVLPFQVCGHLVSTLYAVAERIADQIKADSSLF
ncbi:alcohol oxidase [Aspergillus sclerotioniger CBS 115572]|uniref:glucose oxidase n=1 Tax=Aspergillus sclerotioniger CBS 115572 TaxID=1450535 RepID=A0A317XD95_9EURO|nr:alcohol oxidase [Aspergillus sclerotioniger CBS 115572]PWY96131.1 alcohol oxidase [Aspergillus sclerotioniger CBS 115572]